MIEFAIAAFFYVGTVGIMGALLNFQAARDSEARQGIDERMQLERQEWAEERHQLLERIQRPEHQPVAYVENPEPAPEPLEMDMAMIGTVVSEAPDGE